jgi:hypothetical protein
MCCLGCCSCGVLEYSAVPFRMRVILVFRDNIYVINPLFVRMCGTIDHEHTYDEYLVLLVKSGMTEVLQCQP